MNSTEFNFDTSVSPTVMDKTVTDNVSVDNDNLSLMTIIALSWTAMLIIVQVCLL